MSDALSQAFGFDRRRNCLAGVVFTNKDNYKRGGFYSLYDGGTVSRPNEYATMNEAVTRVYRLRAEGRVFSTLEQLKIKMVEMSTTQGVLSKHTECLMRTKIGEDTKVGIFVDTLESRLYAQFLTEKIQARRQDVLQASAPEQKTPDTLEQKTSERLKPSIVYYIPNSLKVLTPYSEACAQRDLNQAHSIVSDDKQ